MSYFAGSHRLSQVSYGSGTRSFTYYSSGQVLTDTVGGVTTNFTLDPEGRVEALHQGGSPIADYTYDGLGLRVEKTVPTSPTGDSGTLHFIYDVDGRLLAEHDGSTGAVLREYVYFGLMPVAMIVPDGAGGSDVYAIHADQVNMPQKLTDATGTVVHDRVTTPFGELVSGVGSGSSSLTLRFPGQRADGEAGLFQNWMRDYDPALGRYVQSDPIGLAGGINTYAYVGGNPVSYVDPTGLCIRDKHCTGSFSAPLSPTSGPQTNAALQDHFNFGGGANYVVDPQAFGVEYAIDIGSQIRNSIRSGGRMSGHYDNAAASSCGCVAFIEAQPFGFNQTTLSLMLTKSGRGIGRFAGSVDGKICVKADGAYVVEGNITFSRDEYSWALDGNNSLMNAAIALGGMRENRRPGTPSNMFDDTSGVRYRDGTTFTTVPNRTYIFTATGNR